jgi:uncharacterized protein
MLVDEEFDAVALPIVQDEEYQTLHRYMAHGSISVFDHSLLVAERAYLYAKKKHLALDYKALIRGALLHDYYLYDWHKSHKGHRLHGYRHPSWALHNALLRYDLSPKEKNIIRSHMFPLTVFHFPRSPEARIVAKMDHKEARIELRHQNVAQLQKLALA